MSRRSGKKPSRTRRHRESVAAKRKARAFYRMRNGCGTDALPPDEAVRPWRGFGAALSALAAVALVGWTAVKLFT